MFPVPRTPHSLLLTANEKDFSHSLEMTMRRNGLLPPPKEDTTKVMREKWQPHSSRILPPSFGRRCPEGAEVGFHSLLKW